MFVLSRMSRLSRDLTIYHQAICSSIYFRNYTYQRKFLRGKHKQKFMSDFHMIIIVKKISFSFLIPLLRFVNISCMSSDIFLNFASMGLRENSYTCINNKSEIEENSHYFLFKKWLYVWDFHYKSWNTIMHVPCIISISYLLNENKSKDKTKEIEIIYQFYVSSEPFYNGWYSC